jgi:hypothetical protein
VTFDDLAAGDGHRAEEAARVGEVDLGGIVVLVLPGLQPVGCRAGGVSVVADELGLATVQISPVDGRAGHAVLSDHLVATQ